MEKLSSNFVLKNRDLDVSLTNEVLREMILTPSQLKAVPYLVSSSPIIAHFTSFESENGYITRLILEANVEIYDDALQKNVKLPIKTDDYLTLSEVEDENADLIKEHYGYDFTGVILAIFYESIPYRTSIEHFSYDDSSVEVISEDEYFKRQENKNKDNSPFSKLKDLIK